MIKAFCMAVLVYGSAFASIINVPDPASLNGALTSMVAGDTLLLAAADYGSITIKNKLTGFATITSADGNLGAQFGTLTLSDAEYIRLDGLRARVIMPKDSCSHIDILNCNAGGGPDEYDAIAAIRASAGTFSDFRIEGNYMHNATNGSQMFGVTNLIFRENRVDSVDGDSYKFSNIINGLIENNFGAYYYVQDSLAHHDFMQWQGTYSKDVTIRGNVNLVGETSSQSQGIFGGDPSFENLLIENNIIYLGSARAISIPAGTLITVQNNTVLTFPGVLRSSIILPSGSVKRNNVAANKISNAGLDTSGNYTIQHQDSTGEYYYNDFYVNAMVGKGCTIEDLRPVPGSPADGEAGAYERIYELLGISGVNDHFQEWVAPTELRITEDGAYDGSCYTVTGQVCRSGQYLPSGVYLKSSNTVPGKRVILR